MTRHIADIQARGYEDDATIFVTIGALRIRLDLSNDARLGLCKALLGGRGEYAADVHVTPLELPKHLKELTEATLNARTVKG